MNRSLASVQYFGYYTVLMGSTLLFIPGVLPFFLGPGVDTNIWTRLLGFVLICSGYYYIQSSRKGFLDFARWTVHTRLAASLVTLVLVLFELGSWQFLLFGLVDTSAGLVTAYFLRQETYSMRGKETHRM
ncbi:hypothetical protein GCM10023189_45470 [Nibrella saemangeumensis]|uniref:Uncharacterized protein n=1 Tax=Nibrella saemangeumensis TaxID=1084526 RepID=A0ABP8NGJ7_9BACT